MKNLQEIVESNKDNFHSDYKEQILEVINYMDIDLDCLNDENDLYDELDYSGAIHEQIDSLIDIYYYDLRKWSVENFEYIDEALEDGLMEGVTDFHKLIQGGQYKKFSGEIIDDIYSLWHLIQDDVFTAQDEV